MTFMALVRGHVRQQRHRACALDGVSQLALVSRAAARDAAGNDLAPLGDEAAQPAHVLVVDEIDLVRAELTDLPSPEPATLDWLADRGNGCSPFLEGHVVVGAAAAGVGRLVGVGRRRRGSPAGRTLGTAHELDTLGHDLRDRALLPVLGLPVARLQPPLDEDLAALVEVLAAALGLLAPDDHGEEARFL